MGKCIYYVASSLDGFLSDESGGVEWLEPFNNAGYDYGYADFYAKLGYIVSGSKTYEQAKEFPGGWAFPNVETYVFSSRNIDTENRPDIHLWQGTIQALHADLSKKEKDTWIIGGANLAGQFAKLNLIDELVVSIMPIILGKGKPLFDGLEQHHYLTLKNKVIYPNGVVQLTYNLK